MSGIEDAGKKAAKKVSKVAGDGMDAAKQAAGSAAEAAGDAADAGLDAAKGALGAVGGMLGGIAAKASEAAGDAVDATKKAADVVGDTVSDVVEDVVDGAKAAMDGAEDLVTGTFQKTVGGSPAAVGGGAALIGASTVGAGTGGSDGGLPPLSARLDEAERRRPAPGFILPALGVAGLGFLAYFGWQTIATGEGTLFKQREPAPVVAAAPAAPVASAIPAWLSSIGTTLKATFAWLTLGISGNSVIASGEAETQADKDNALKEITLAVKATAEGANSDIIDNIKVKGATDTPVGAALAALGVNPNVGACNTAFATTMAGRTINFSTGGASIRGDNAALLNTLTAVTNACNAHKIEVAGHTDTVGTPENNQALSQKRAEAVKAYWTGKGVAAEGLVAMGYGEGKPLEVTPDETANEKNRRIEFTVSDAAVPAVPAVAVEPAK